MDILSVSVNTPLRIYYKAHNLESGLDVVFNIWDANGTPLQTGVPADGEIGTRGVYYLDIVTPTYDTYLLVKASTSSGARIGTITNVYQVGIPSIQKLFYVDGGYKTGQTHQYRIFDIAASTEQLGTLDEVAGGFYSTDVGVQSNLDLFFKVGTLVKEFDLLDSSVVFVTGGVVVGGTALFAQEIAISGGVVVGGVADAVSFLPAEGGVVADGTAEVQSYFSPEGGILTGGKASVEDFVVGSGGVVCGGSAATEEFINVSGGVVVGRGATAEISYIPNPNRTQTSCYFIGEIVYLKYPSTGLLPARYEQHLIQGVRFFGDRYLYDIGLGVLIDSSFLLSASEFAADQAAELNRVSQISQDRLDRLDNTPILPDPSGGSIKERIQLSKDPISVDFTDKINRLQSMVPGADPSGGLIKQTETEGAPKPDRYSALMSKLNRLKTMTVEPEPTGGAIKVAKTISKPKLNDVAAKISKKLQRLQSQSVAPAPTGGQITFSQTDGNKRVDVTSAKRKLEELQKVALLPDPKGAYILVSMETEGDQQKFADLEANIQNKLNLLLEI